MSSRVDQGEIILQKQFPLGTDETLDEALSMLIEQVPDMMTETMEKIGTTVRKPVCPSDSSSEPGSSFPRRLSGDEQIDWCDTSQNIHNKIRALSQPGLYAAVCTADNGVIRIMRSRMLPEYPATIGIPGSIIERNSTGVIVKTGDTALQLTAVIINDCEDVPAWPVSYRLLSLEETRLRRLERQVAELTNQFKQYERAEYGELCG
jgi:methionyl-tRNA formyltransferase